jgi:peptidoglycan/LPS O-acetylase OafA/YrhL
MSYSVYLLQFPLQMVFSYVVLSLSLPRTVFFSPWVLLSFFAVLVPLSWGSYTYFERPLQDYLRAKLLKPSLLVPRALESATVVATKRPSEP